MISDPDVVRLLYLVAIVCFIVALRFLSSPKHARRGNWVGGAGIEDHFRDGRFHDLFVRVEGPVVAQLQLVFLASFRWLGGAVPTTDLPTLVAEVDALVADGLRVKDACARVVEAHPGAPSRRELYDAVLRARE